MNAISSATAQPSRFETGRLFIMAGLSERLDCMSGAAIGSLWQRFQPYVEQIPGRVGQAAYGIVCDADASGGASYMCAVEVRDWAPLPAQLSRLEIPEQRYAVFVHRGHVAGLRASWDAIWREWLPSSGRQATAAPVLERYGEQFDARTGVGDIELWVPIKTAG